MHTGASSLSVQPGASFLQKPGRTGEVEKQRQRPALVIPREPHYTQEGARGRRTRGEEVRTQAVGTPGSPQFFFEIESMLDFSEVSRRDPDRPSFHVMPRGGWMNDPNGPIYYRGRYHLFYQHVTTGCEWNWGIVWGHATSKDLVHWEHVDLALEPTPGSFDADGCFSGCCTIDPDNGGVPTILYTGVRLRSNPDYGPLPPQECDLQLPFIESQGMAVALPGDDKLQTWAKMESPILPLPPPNMPLVGWRDPFVFQQGGSGSDWIILMGSGIKGEGGAVLVYRTQNLKADWQLAGLLCLGDADTGAMWECPLLTKLKPYIERPAQGPVHALGLKRSLSGSGNWSTEHEVDDQFMTAQTEEVDMKQALVDAATMSADIDERYQYLLCISPDAPTNPVICYLGQYEDLKFNLEEAKGPFRLDLGDIMYAPNISEDPQGRTLLWGWLQERRKVGSYEYSGCLSLPRVLSLKGSKLMQQPACEVDSMRSGAVWHDADLLLYPEEPTPLPRVGGEALDLSITLERGSSDAAGLLLRSWHIGGEGSAAIVFDWERNSLEVVFEAVDPDTMEFCLDAEASRRVGGTIDLRPGEPLELRILLDHSCVEIFTSTGDVLSTRVYRGSAPPGADSGIDFVSFGGSATISRVAAYEMSTIWKAEVAAGETAKEVLEATTHPMFASISI